jgi:hypothetical protein
LQVQALSVGFVVFFKTSLAVSKELYSTYPNGYRYFISLSNTTNWFGVCTLLKGYVGPIRKIKNWIRRPKKPNPPNVPQLRPIDYIYFSLTYCLYLDTWLLQRNSDVCQLFIEFTRGSIISVSLNITQFAFLSFLFYWISVHFKTRTSPKSIKISSKTTTKPLFMT